MADLLTRRYESALVYAFWLHQRQERKDSRIPYFAHLAGVSAIVIEYGGSEDQAIAALLHDAVEDQGGKPTLERIRTTFGEKVASIVEACSDSNTTPKPPWTDRKQKYLAHLPEIAKPARLVSLADKFYNATTIWWDMQKPGIDVWGRFNAPMVDVLWYYCRLANIYQDIYPGVLADEFHALLLRILANSASPYSYEDLSIRLSPPGHTSVEIVDQA